MSAEVAALIGTAVTLLVAAVCAFGWLVAHTERCVAKETESRHTAMNRAQNALSEVENRLTSRIARVEALSFGYRRWAGHEAEGNGDGC